MTVATASAQRYQDRRAALVEGGDFYWLRVTPSCPPDRRVHMQGGMTFLGYNPTLAPVDDYQWRAYTVPPLTAQVDDPNSVYNEVYFSNANYYQLFVLGLATPAVVELPGIDDWSFYLHGTGDEFATAAEAEQWINSYDFQTSNTWSHPPWPDLAVVVAMPLCGLILRNDGRVGTAGAFLPIDAMNRGRSYQWPSDYRPRLAIYR